jgi:hypothetical protein
MKSKSVVDVGFLIRFGFTIAERSLRSSGIGTCHQEHVFFHFKVMKDNSHNIYIPHIQRYLPKILQTIMQEDIEIEV